ncbi:PH domain-containing protein [Nocardioides sp. AX2bis]|uniref:PH domain-containing protein n=1 Tax=Nocardioides sp. AX2bis TaxID=2653157 RepID=UPI001F1DC083|nr:PH domain-containing protein [Nocardioides sp. AX2bis]
MVDLREPRERVSPRARWMWMLAEGLESAVAIGVLWAALALPGWVDVRWWWVALAITAAVAYMVVVPQWRYLVHRWEVTDTAVYTQVGWWSRERRIAPMSRIQTVDYTESGLSRLFGLATVTITTASAAGALSVAGLDRTVARGLADELTHKADAVEGDAT